MSEERVVHHYNEVLGSNNFDLEDSFCSRANQIIGIADLFFCMGQGGDRQITSNGAYGIYRTLEEAAEELRTICYWMMEQQPNLKKDRTFIPSPMDRAGDPA